MSITNELRMIQLKSLHLSEELNTLSRTPSEEKYQAIGFKLQEIFLHLQKLHDENYSAEVDGIQPGDYCEGIVDLYKRFHFLSSQQGLAPFSYASPSGKEMRNSYLANYK